MAKPLLQRRGFAGELLDTFLGVEWVECLDPDESTCTCHPELPARRGLHFADAVGDVDLVDDKWGPSIGAAQIRALRDPNGWGRTDVWRVADKLRDPDFNAQAAYAVVEGGAKLDLWSAHKHGTFRPYVGLDFELHFGHRRAHLWNA
ncbi:MAG: hypothetical protein ACREF4_09185 [Gammaproteobacteria bacterium]